MVIERLVSADSDATSRDSDTTFAGTVDSDSSAASAGDASAEDDVIDERDEQEEIARAIDDAGVAIDDAGAEALVIDRTASRPRTGAGARALRFRAHTIFGSHQETRARLSGRHIDVAMRRVLDETVGFAHWRSRRVSAVVGRIALTAGEGLLLGRGPETFPGFRDVSAAQLRLRGTLSHWSGASGAAAQLSAGVLRVAAAVVRDDAVVRPWFSVEAHGRRGHIGVATSVWGDAPAIVSAYGHNGRVSWELMRLGGHGSYGAVRLHARRATLLLYHAPLFAAYTLLQPLPRLRLFTRGVQFDVTRRTYLRWSARVWLGTALTAFGHRRFRRLDVAVSGTVRRRFRWRARVVAIASASGAYASARHESARRLRSDIELRAHGGPGVRHLIRLGVWLPGAGRDGLALTVGSDVTQGRFDLAWRVTAYRLPPGERVFVSRPTPTASDRFSLLGGSGSDVSLRFRVRLAGALRLLAYVRRSPEAASRIYLGADVR
jgi:hypothetical protein